MGSVRVFLVAARIEIVFVAGVPVRPFLVGVILISQVPAFFKRMVQVAVRFWVFLLVLTLQVPRAVRVVRVWKRRVALLVAVIVYVTSGAAVKLAVIGWLVVRVPRAQRMRFGVAGGVRGVKVAVVVRASVIERVQVLVPAQAPLQPVNVELVVGVAVRVTLVSSSKPVVHVVVHATPLGLELIDPVPDPALMVVSAQVTSNGEASDITPLERLPGGATDRPSSGVVELPPLHVEPQVMTLPSVLSAANAA